MGEWVSFRTQWGSHRGIVEQVNHRGVLVRVPRQYVPATLINGTDNDKLDVGLARWGGAYGPYGAYGGYGGGKTWGYPGYGAWYGGWWWWWLAFAWIFWLAFLW